MNWKSCIDENLIRNDPRAQDRVPATIDAADRFLSSARRTCETGEYELALLAAYNSAFHCARPLLFANGYTERSHACVILVLRHLFRDDSRFLQFLATLDKMRISRHNVQYGVSRVTRGEAEFSIRFAGDFLQFVRERATPS